MPKAKRTVAPKSKTPLTVGDIFSKISKLQANQLLYVALLVAIFLLGYLFARVQFLEGGNGGDNQIITQGGDPSAIADPNEVVDVAIGHFPVEGDENASVTIVEFSDFECPFCKSYYDGALAQIREEYINNGDVKFYFRHFPLDFHPAANPAALASECANEQGLFWEFHDLVFEEQSRIEGGGETANNELKAMAAELGLNTGQFNQCFDTAKYQTSVDEDVADGQAAGVSGTPTIFINGRRIVGAQPYDTFKTIIDEELNS